MIYLFRIFDCVISAVLGLVIILGPTQHPLIVAHLLPEIVLEPSSFGFFIVVPFRTFSCLSEIIFRAYVHISVTNIPNVLISTRTICILISSYILVIVTGFIIVTFNVGFDIIIVSNAIALLFRAFFVPTSIIVSNESLSQTFVNKVQDLGDSFKDFMTSTTNKLNMSLSLLKNIICSNQVAPQPQDQIGTAA